MGASTAAESASIAPPLTIEQVREIFLRFDADRDGQLSFNEIKSAFNYLGALIPAYRACFGMWHADKNGDGRVDKKELEDLVKYAYNIGYTVK